MELISKKVVDRSDEILIQKILDIAEQLIYNNKVLTSKLLYRVAKRHLKMPRRNLLKIIELLFDQKVLIEGSKLTRDVVLSNQKRFVIYKFIKEQFVSTYSMIKRGLRFHDKTPIKSSGELIWHLQMLLKFELIKRISYKNYSLFMLKELDNRTGIFVFTLRDELNQKIVHFILEKHSVKKSDIYKGVDEGRQRVDYRVNNLINIGLLSIGDSEANNVRISPSRKRLICETIKNIQFSGLNHSRERKEESQWF